jgi:hypothetical protein
MASFRNERPPIKNSFQGAEWVLGNSLSRTDMTPFPNKLNQSNQLNSCSRLLVFLKNTCKNSGSVAKEREYLVDIGDRDAMYRAPTAVAEVFK